MSESSRDISRLIDRTLFEEARRNELNIAYVRATVMTLVTALLTTASFVPSTVGASEFPAINAALSGLYWLGAVAAAIAMHRGWFVQSLRLIFPIFDGVLVFGLFFMAWNTADAGTTNFSGVVGSAAAVCVLLAVSGGLRLRRLSVVFSTALAVATFAAVSILTDYGAVRAGVVLVIVVGAGGLGIWMTDIVRRARESEIGRIMLTRFLPREVVEKAHANPMALLTEARSVTATVLVTDIRGFTSKSETVRPADALAFLNRIQGVLADLVRRNGGMVDKFLGDGMLAVFGAPEEMPDHAARALRTATDIFAAIRAFNANSAEGFDNFKPVRIGAGIHSGELIVGCLGSGVRLEFTCIGDTVNTASRLEALTKEHAVDLIVSADTMAAAGVEFAGAFPPIGDVPIRGRQRPLFIHGLRVATEAAATAAGMP